MIQVEVRFVRLFTGDVNYQNMVFGTLFIGHSISIIWGILDIPGSKVLWVFREYMTKCVTAEHEELSGYKRVPNDCDQKCLRVFSTMTDNRQ